jgi:hypothetical protein
LHLKPHFALNRSVKRCRMPATKEDVMLHDTLSGDHKDLPASSGYCAPYLYLLEEDTCVEQRQVSVYSKRKLSHIQRAIRAGAGQGLGEHYTPWIRITRRFSSPVSKMIVASVSIHRRSHHFLSKLENDTALQMAYLGASELRECLPMWPTPHAHPLPNHDGDVPGLLELAEQAGIDHGIYVGTTVPYVGSLDLLTCIRVGRRHQYLGVSCKPTEIYERSDRARERVALDAQYCQAIGARHHREGGDGFNARLVTQLHDYRPLHSELGAYGGTARLADFSSHFNELALNIPVAAAIDVAGAKVSATHAEASALWRVGIWTHLVDIDLRRRVSMLKPVKPGVADVLRSLAVSFLGGSHE